MKKSLILILCGLLLGAAAAWAVIHYVVPLRHRSAVDNTFWQVTSRLDQGGEAFAYVHAEEISKAVQSVLSGLTRNVAALPEERRPQAMQGLNMLELMFKGYGLDEVSGLGFSSIAVKPGLHRVRTVIHHRPGRNKGLLWNIFGPSPRPLDEIALLPADTTLASVSDYNLFKLVEWASQLGPKIASQGAQGPNQEQAMAMMKAGLQALGIDYDRLLKSYGGRLGFLLILNPEKRVILPAKDKPLSIPEPEIALLLRVNDSYLFDTLKGKLPPQARAKFSEAGGMKRIVFPSLPAPFPVEPVVVQKGEWLLAATHPSLVEKILDKHSPRLSETEVFKAISYRIPRRGNGFMYASPALPRLVGQVMRENMAAFQPRAALEKIISVLDRSKGLYSIMENSDQGLVYTINHGLEVSSLPGLVEAFVEIAAEKARIKAATAEPPAEEQPQQGK